MKTYTHNNKEYRYDEKVDWIDAMAVNGFYFHRAVHLKMPKPPACFVFSNDEDDLTNDELALIADYHELFKTKNDIYERPMIEAWNAAEV